MILSDEAVGTCSMESTDTGLVDEYIAELFGGKYWDDVSRIKLLSPEEEAALGKRILRGGAAAREAQNALVQHNLRLVRMVIKKEFLWCLQHNISLEDMIQEGNLGLITAAEKFDYRIGKFSAYATWWIRHKLHRAIAETCRTVRLPTHLQVTAWQIERFAREHEHENQKQPAVSDIVAETGIPARMVRRVLSLQSRTVSLAELEVREEERNTLLECIPDTATPPPSMRLEAAQELAQLEKSVAEVVNAVTREVNISERNVRVFRSLYGIDGSAQRTLDETSVLFDITRERVRQIVQKIWSKLEEVGIGGDHNSLLGALASIEELREIVSIYS